MPSIGVLAICGLLAVLYAQTFDELTRIWVRDPNYSHAYAVPLVSLWFAWQAWKQIGVPWRNRVPKKSVRAGTITLAVGLAVHAEAWFTGLLLLDVIGLVVILRGALLVLGGRRASRAYGFSAMFLVFAAPWPTAWYVVAANQLQELVSVVSAGLLATSGFPVLREGNLLHLPGHTIEVAEACSGLRQLTAFLAMSVAVGGLNRGSRWLNLALVALSIPIAVACNCARIVLTVAILDLAGPAYAKEVFHSLEGTAVAALGLLSLLATAAGLNAVELRLASRKKRSMVDARQKGREPWASAQRLIVAAAKSGGTR